MTRLDVACDLLHDRGFDDAAQVLREGARRSGFDCPRCVNAAMGNHWPWCPVERLKAHADGPRYPLPAWWRALASSKVCCRSSHLTALANAGVAAEEALLKMAEAYEDLLERTIQLAERMPTSFVVTDDNREDP